MNRKVLETGSEKIGLVMELFENCHKLLTFGTVTWH